MITLALGIGANTAIFSVFNTVVLQPVSVPEPDTLVQLVSTVNGEPLSTEASVDTYTYWRELADVIEDVMLLMTIFGLVALLLTAIGVYGLVAYSVQQRTHEIGIRMALGARRDNILGMVIRHGVLLAAMGAALGITAAYFLASLLTSALYGVEPRDAAVFIAVPITLAVVVLVAVSIPAYRASRLHPLHALRSE